jgi:hypothetical protein
MPYALIPNDYTLEKVTKEQKQAVEEKRSHDDVLTVLANPATSQLVALLGAGLSTAYFLPLFIAALEKKVGTLGDDFKSAVNETVNELNPLNIVREKAGLKSNEELIAELQRKAEAQKNRDRPPGV